MATLLNACRFSTIGERNVHSKGFSQEICCSLIIHENRWSFLAIFIHLINLIKFNRFSKSNMVNRLNNYWRWARGQGSTLQLVGWSIVGKRYSWRTALRIFLILCIHVPYYKGKKRTRPFFQEKSGSLIIHENRFWPFSPVWGLWSTWYCILW